MPAAVTRSAHAKLNLALWVGPPLPDGERSGFHPICSWMSCISLCDQVTVEPEEAGRGSSLEIRWAEDAPRPTPVDWAAERDLTMRALRALEAHAARPLAARVRVLKRIPVGSGLGGGSSDAAAALRAANRAFGLELDDAALRSLGAGLGSDVPFFIDSTEDGPARPAIVSGLGETVERHPRVGAEVLLVVPPFSCATADVYRAFDRLADEGLSRARITGGAPAVARGDPADDQLVRKRAARAAEIHRVEGRFLFNSLTPAAMTVEPRLRSLLSAVANVTNCHTRLTGSGSCVFVPLEAGRIEHAQSQLEKAVVRDAALEGCRVVRTRLV